MSGTAHMQARADHVPVLHNCGPSTSTVAVTGAVGTLMHCRPSHTITWLLADAGLHIGDTRLIGRREVSAIHPAFIAVAVGAAMRIVTAALSLPCDIDDAELMLTVRSGRRRRDQSFATCAELALQRLATLSSHVQPLFGEMHFHGIAEWVTRTPTIGVDPLTRGVTLRGRARDAVIELMLVAYASPPIISLRRAPSLEYFRTGGVVVLRSFAPRLYP